MPFQNPLSKLACVSCLLGTALIFGPATANAAPCDQLLGTYQNPDGKRVVKITKSGGRFAGRVVSSREKNGQAMVGKTVFRAFRCDTANNRLVDGRIISPFNGRKYRGRLSSASNGDLIVRGFVAVPIFGNSARFKRLR